MLDILGKVTKNQASKNVTVKEKLNHKYGFLEPGLLGTNYAKKKSSSWK